ncbi:unnamed protein product [Dimorphilus gyrociliatus]|uniref:Ig-like domain-containing protein n=1 Tax=Dimorphilus gyrociliatus TaxID=2664684 RepID=A0A7I8W2M5_9ANNE|nr:unnamed protein product [Dimorphilus gyrociliatus]
MDENEKIDIFSCPQLFYYDSNENRCISCKPGSYYDKEKRDCFPCAPGEYSSSSGLLRCIPCPKNLITNTFGAINKNQCMYKQIEVSQVYGTIGQTVKVSCLPEFLKRRNLLPNFIKWFKASKVPLNSNKRSLDLTINDASDAGIYTCSAVMKGKSYEFNHLILLIDLNTIRFKVTYGLLTHSCFDRYPWDIARHMTEYIKNNIGSPSKLNIHKECGQDYGEVLLNRRWPDDIVNCRLINHPTKPNVQYCYPKTFKTFFLFGEDYYNLTGNLYRPNIGDNTYYRKLQRISVVSKPDKGSIIFNTMDCMWKAYSTLQNYYRYERTDEDHDYNVYIRHLLRILRYDASVKMEYPFANFSWTNLEWIFAVRYCIVCSLFGNLRLNLYNFTELSNSSYESKFYNKYGQNGVIKSPLSIEYDCDKGYEPDEYMLLCIGCQPGYYKHEKGRNRCLECPLNTYQDYQGQQLCKLCPNSTFTESTASFDLSHCLIEYPNRILVRDPIIRRRPIGFRVSIQNINFQTDFFATFPFTTSQPTLKNWIKILIGLCTPLLFSIIVYGSLIMFARLKKPKKDKQEVLEILLKSKFRRPNKEVEDALLLVKSIKNKNLCKSG